MKKSFQLLAVLAVAASSLSFAHADPVRAISDAGVSIKVSKIETSVLTSDDASLYGFKYDGILAGSRDYVSTSSRMAAYTLAKQPSNLCAQYNTNASLADGLKWSVEKFEIGSTSCSSSDGQLSCETPLTANCVSAKISQ